LEAILFCSITLLISCITSKKILSLSGDTTALTSLLKSFTVLLEIAFFSLPRGVRKILTDLLSIGSGALYIKPFCSMVFNILVKLLASNPISGAIFVAGVPSSLWMFNSTKPMEVVISFLIAFWLYILYMACQAAFML